MSKKSSAVFLRSKSFTFMVLLLTNLDPAFFFFLYHFPPMVDIPFDLAEYAGKNPHVFVFQPGAAQDSAECQMHMRRIFRVDKADLQKSCSHTANGPLTICRDA